MNIDFEKLKQKYGTHQEAARVMGIPVRTYFEWKKRMAADEELPPAQMALLEKWSSCPDDSTGSGAANP